MSCQVRPRLPDLPVRRAGWALLVQQALLVQRVPPARQGPPARQALRPLLVPPLARLARLARLASSFDFGNYARSSDKRAGRFCVLKH